MNIKLMIFPILALLSSGELIFAKDSSTAGCIECELANSQSKNESKDLEQKAFNQLNFLDPAIVESTDSRKLAEMIVNRLSENCDKVRDPLLKPPDDSNTEIIMLVPDKYLTSIQKYGFKNQHQTSTTGGCNCKDKRVNFESAHVGLGIPYSNKTRELLPKYALHVFKDEKHGMSMFPTGYGNVAIKFKPSVKRRATWNPRDSLNTTENLRTYKIREAKGTACDGYCESQIWGELDMSDVESIRIPEDLALTDSMKALNVPIYTYGNITAEDVKNKNLPRYGSVVGVRFLDKAVYLPKGLPKGKDERDLSAAKKDLESASNDAQRTFVSGEVLSKSSTDSLIKKYENMISRTDENQQNFNSEKTRIVAELAARNRESKVAPLLKKIFTKEDGVFIRAVAISGLTNIPWKDLKPMFLQMHSQDDSGSRKNSLLNFKIGILRDHLDDSEIRKIHDELVALRQKDAYFADKPSCEKEAFD